MGRVEGEGLLVSDITKNVMRITINNCRELFFPLSSFLPHHLIVGIPLLSLNNHHSFLLSPPHASPLVFLAIPFPSHRSSRLLFPSLLIPQTRLRSLPKPCRCLPASRSVTPLYSLLRLPFLAFLLFLHYFFHIFHLEEP